MAIYSYDIVSTLQALGMMKYWKGKHIVLKKQVGARCLCKTIGNYYFLQLIMIISGRSR